MPDLTSSQPISVSLKPQQRAHQRKPQERALERKKLRKVLRKTTMSGGRSYLLIYIFLSGSSCFWWTPLQNLASSNATKGLII